MNLTVTCFRKLCHGQKCILISWLLVAMIVSGELNQIGSFEGRKATGSFDVKQDCFILLITVENNEHISTDLAYLPGLSVALVVSEGQSVLNICCYFYFDSLSTNFGF